VLLENANLCNPAVLDRLNPLMEPGGNLLVSACKHWELCLLCSWGAGLRVSDSDFVD
jgi:hypothetical protein